MLMQPLLDQLIQLHLPAFRDGLQEQLHNPQYAELSFEERLALLVEWEVTHRRDHRLQRRIKLATFPQAATVEDLDLSPARHGLTRVHDEIQEYFFQGMPVRLDRGFGRNI